MSSDSEEFASADENSTDGKETKARCRYRKSSSNNDSENGTLSKSKKLTANDRKTTETENEGWDDFDVDEEASAEADPTAQSNIPPNVSQQPKPSDKGNKNQDKSKFDPSVSEKEKNEAGDGWDNFDDDWSQDNESITQKPICSQPTPSEDRVKSVADRLAQLNAKDTSSGGWGWGGWGVNSLLNTATAGISTLTSTVSQGISSVSNVIESGIGIPDPEEFAKRNQTEDTAESSSKEEKVPSAATTEDAGYISKSSSGDTGFALGSLMSGVSHITKFVENTGTKVITGGLDTLESIGKKTMEVLQDGDPGLAKKRAMLGLDSGDKPVLSQILREAKSKADEEDRIKEQRKEAKEVHYETLFDDFGGLVHLEALEMLSRQVSMSIEAKLRSAAPEKRREMQETMQQVAELCEINDSDDEIDDVTTDKELSPSETLYNRLREATQDSALDLQFQPIVKHYESVVAWLDSAEAGATRATYKRGVGALAQAGALAVELLHKAAELLLVRTRRATADESDAQAQMTQVLTRHVNELAKHFTEKLHRLGGEGGEDTIGGYITNIFLEANNTVTYVQNAFQLTLPILQIGAL